MQHLPGDASIDTNDLKEIGRLLSAELKCGITMEGGKPIFTCKHEMRLPYFQAKNKDWNFCRSVHEEAKKKSKPAQKEMVTTITERSIVCPQCGKAIPVGMVIEDKPVEAEA